MTSTHQKGTFVCIACGKTKPVAEGMYGEMIRHRITEVIRASHPEWTPDRPVCHTCLDRFRGEYVEGVLAAERGELSTLEREVVHSLKARDLLARDVNAHFERQLTLGERVADKVAAFGGSWTFIGSFGAVIVAWIVLNSTALFAPPFDRYPYILLNLILSCLAALQAPVIMMSQRRQESKDRLRGENDYRVNLKAELEIRQLNAKLDQLMTHQWQRLLEIQQVQMDIMRDSIRQATGNSQK